MKKILLTLLCLALVVCLVASLAACDLFTPNEPNDPNNPNENPPSECKHQWSEAYQEEGDKHYQTCNLCQEKKYSDHTYVDGVCVCGKKEPQDDPKPVPADGLEMELVDSAYYIVKGIGTFQGAELVIPETYGEDNLPVKQIGYRSFLDNTQLTSVTIPASITYINGYAFKGCTSLATINFNAEECERLEPTAFDNVGKNVTGGTTCNFGESVKYVPEKMFNDRKNCNVTKINFAENGNLKKIGALAFDDLELTELTIPSTVEYIGSLAFADLNKLKILNYNAENCRTDTNANVFYYLGSDTNNGTLLTVGATVKRIPANLFYTYEKMGKIVFEDIGNLEFVGENAFMQTRAKEGVWIDDFAAFCNVSYDNAGASPMYMCEGGLYINGELLPENYTIPAEAKSIPAGTFYYSQITEIVIPDTVEYIGESAFYYCRQLKKVSVGSGVKKIDNSAFNICTKLEEITFSEGLEELGIRVFERNALTELTLPNSLLKMGSSAILSSTLKTLHIGSGLQEMHEGALELTAVENITVDPQNKYYTSIDGSLYSKDGSILYDYAVQNPNATFVLPDTVKHIVDYALSGKTNDVGYTKYGGANYIGTESNPYFCLHKITNETLLARSVHEDTVIISNGAFTGAKRSFDLVIPATNLKYIGDDAFYNFSIISKVTIGDFDKWCGVELADYDSNPIHYTRKMFDSSGSEVTSLEISEGVTKIGAYAFIYAKNLKSVVIPDSVETIGEEAFRYSGLKQITFGKGLKHIEFAAFESTLGTELVLPENLETIGSWAFHGCKSLKKVTVPASLKSVGQLAFFENEHLEEVHISDLASWCQIDFERDGNPLRYAHDLYLNGELVEDLVIPESVTVIKPYAFIEGAFKTLTLNAGLTEIGDFAFEDCDSIEEVTVPASVRKFGFCAFLYCDNLRKFDLEVKTGWYASKNADMSDAKLLSNPDNAYWIKDLYSDYYWERRG